MRNFKGECRCFCFICVLLIINQILGFALIPPTYARLGIHNIMENSYDDIFIGTSKGFSAINPRIVDSVTGRSSTSLCMGSVFPIDDLYLIKEACKKGNPDRIIYELDPSYYVVDEFQGIQDPFIYNEMQTSFNKMTYYVDKYLKEDFRIFLFPWLFHRNGYNTLVQNIKQKNSKEYKEYNPLIVDNKNAHYQEEGFLFYDKSEEDIINEEGYLTWKESDIKMDREADFQRIVEFCNAQNIELITVILPVATEVLVQHPDGYKQSDKYYKALMERHNVKYINFNYCEDEYQFDRTLQDYRDYEGHMYGQTANKFSELLGNYLNNYQR